MHITKGNIIMKLKLLKIIHKGFDFMVHLFSFSLRYFCDESLVLEVGAYLCLTSLAVTADVDIVNYNL